ncbi:MAG: SAM-dependent methyltransferase [Mycobacteriales bacterium]
MSEHLYFRPWREAMTESLYGANGFFVRELPRAHFRTAATAGPLLARAVRRLAGRVDDALGRPDPFELVDLGAGGGELLAALPEVPPRWQLTAVESYDRWPTGVHGLVMAHELLDNVPLDVTFDGRLVEVARNGTERLGAVAPPELLAWSAQWWPRSRRVEVGLARDEVWRRLVGTVHRGLAVAVDYGHTATNRRTSLTGYVDGHQVAPTPDGSRDLTAHVAVDSCAATTGARLMVQRDALSLLGIRAVPPDRRLADTDPRGYLELLRESQAASELLAPRGLGSFSWLVQPVAIADPLTDLPA